MKLKAFHLLILFGIILLITAMQLSLATLSYKLMYFCIGASFGVLMALAIFKVVKLIELEFKIKKYIKILFITVILLLLVYVAPMQYLYTSNDLTLILIYASGGFILGGVTGIILTKEKEIEQYC
jgi:hypothetical protein